MDGLHLTPAAKALILLAGALALLACAGCASLGGGDPLAATRGPTSPASVPSAAQVTAPPAPVSPPPPEQAAAGLQFFAVTASDVVTQAVEARPAGPVDGPVLPASVEEAAALAGFMLWEPAYLPQGYALAHIDYYPDAGSVGMLYTSPDGKAGSLYFLQQASPFDEAQRQVGPSAAVEKLLVGGAPAEFARGVWQDAGSSDTVQRWRWDPAEAFGRLLWERNGIYFQISIDEHGDLETARQVAASLGPHFAVRAAEQAPPATALPEATAVAVDPASGPVLHTSIGDFRVSGARFADEVNGARPGPGEKIVLVFLAGAGGERLDPARLSLEAFARALQGLPAGGARLIGDDGSSSSSTMSGWVGEEFALGFRVPAAATNFTLYWPGSDMVEVTPEE